MISSPVPVLACRLLESSGEFVYGGTPSYYDGQNWPDAHLSAAAGRRQSRGFWLKTQEGKTQLPEGCPSKILLALVN